MALPPEGQVSPSVRQRIEGDPFAKRLGIRLLDLAPGRAKLAMTLEPDMTNFHGTGHGGAIFSLADAAHAAASNSRGEVAVATHLSIHYLRPGMPGMTLVAFAQEEFREGRTALYAITVRDEATGELLASCQGRVHLRAS